mmetsp:Transcript_32448/g.103461  ORF Transcript_32448/g.103461 Transcript_32448/m.103461 type:complete len:291 (+) Transcript_32448:143-1015(+)
MADADAAKRLDADFRSLVSEGTAESPEDAPGLRACAHRTAAWAAGCRLPGSRRSAGGSAWRAGRGLVGRGGGGRMACSRFIKDCNLARERESSRIFSTPRCDFDPCAAGAVHAARIGGEGQVARARSDARAFIAQRARGGTRLAGRPDRRKDAAVGAADARSARPAETGPRTGALLAPLGAGRAPACARAPPRALRPHPPAASSSIHHAHPQQPRKLFRLPPLSVRPCREPRSPSPDRDAAARHRSRASSAALRLVPTPPAIRRANRTSDPAGTHGKPRTSPMRRPDRIA